MVKLCGEFFNSLNTIRLWMYWSWLPSYDLHQPRRTRAGEQRIDGPSIGFRTATETLSADSTEWSIATPQNITSQRVHKFHHRLLVWQSLPWSIREIADIHNSCLLYNGFYLLLHSWLQYFHSMILWDMHRTTTLSHRDGNPSRGFATCWPSSASYTLRTFLCHFWRQLTCGTHQVRFRACYPSVTDFFLIKRCDTTLR